ncbi:MAG: DUF1211 domain-containing protein [Flavobacteriaceae bacterium]|nr:DUF1211 domain-containing protein [Flavobacteriaceae bacterium]
MKFLHSQSRIEGFSDAVFALAATLMVVSIDTEKDFTLLDGQFNEFIGFGISFAVLVLIWMVHYNFFRRTRHIDSVIITLNMSLLFIILYFVFPLKTMIKSWFENIGLTLETLAGLFELYGLGFCLIFGCFSGMYYRAYRKDRSEGKNLTLLFYSRHYAIFVLVGLLSIITAISKVGITYALPGPIYALLGPLCYAHGVWFKRRYEDSQSKFTKVQSSKQQDQHV